MDYGVEIARKAVTVSEGTPVCLYGIACHMALDYPLGGDSKCIIHFRAMECPLVGASNYKLVLRFVVGRGPNCEVVPSRARIQGA